MTPRFYVSYYLYFCMNECFILVFIHGRSFIVFFFGCKLEANHKIMYSSLIYLLDNFM